MNKQTEAMKLALEALKELRMLGMNAQWHDSWLAKPNEAITAIREALAEQETVLPGGAHVPAVPVAVYGYCPECGGAGVMRERRPNGDDKCTNGHKYPSSKALAEQPAQQHWLYDPMTGKPIQDEQPAQQQEPVAWMWMLDGEVWDLCSTKDRFTPIREGHIQVPLYTSPPASKPWVGLTEQEREKLRWQALEEYAGYTQLIKATEAKLRKKNS